MYCKLFLLIFLSLSISCKQQLLKPLEIPPPTDFTITPTPKPTPTPIPKPEDKVEVKVEVSPIVAPDGAVFGGLSRRFMFKNKWHVLATNMYKYNNDSSLTLIATNLILRIDNESKIIVYAQNLPSRSSTTTWKILSEQELWISANNINAIYATNRAVSARTESFTYNFPTGGERYFTYYDYIEDSYIDYRNTEDLINWNTKDLVRYQNIKFPPPSAISGDSFLPPIFGGKSYLQGIFQISKRSLIYFNGYIYILGGTKSFQDDNISGGRDTSSSSYNNTIYTYWRIKADAGNDGRISSKWESRNLPFGRRANLSARVYNDRLYVYNGAEYEHRHNSSISKWEEVKTKSYTDVWSTADGINWKKEDNPLSGYTEGDEYTGLPVYANIPPPTPEASKYPIIGNRSYQLVGSQYPRISMDVRLQIDNITNKIMEYVEKGELYYPFEEKDKIVLENINLHFKNFRFTDNGYIYYQLNPTNEMSTEFMWFGSDINYLGKDSLFNINNKLVRIIDYDYLIKSASSTQNKWKTEYERLYEIYNKAATEWRERGYIAIDDGIYKDNTGTLAKKEYTEDECFYNTMINEAYRDVYKELKDFKYAMPSKPVTHYYMDIEY